jgi:hypothetical protein
MGPLLSISDGLCFPRDALATLRAGIDPEELFKDEDMINIVKVALPDRAAALDEIGASAFYHLLPTLNSSRNCWTNSSWGWKQIPATPKPLIVLQRLSKQSTRWQRNGNK